MIYVAYNHSVTRGTTVINGYGYVIMKSAPPKNNDDIQAMVADIKAVAGMKDEGVIILSWQVM